MNKNFWDGFEKQALSYKFVNNAFKKARDLERRASLSESHHLLEGHWNPGKSPQQAKRHLRDAKKYRSIADKRGKQADKFDAYTEKLWDDLGKSSR